MRPPPRIARRLVLPAALALSFLSVSGARGATDESLLDPTHWGVVYDVPATRDVRLEAGVRYFADASDTLTIDVYHPPGSGASPKPAVVFLNAIGDPPGERKVKSWGIYSSWPRLIAAQGMVGISMDADPDRIQESLAALFRFLERDGARHGVDAARLGVYAASANVTGSTAYLFGGQAWRGIRAAALYYGQPPRESLRRDLPVLFIVAESDTSGQRDNLTELWRRVVTAGAPWTLTFGTDQPHAFDAFSDNDGARRLVRQTIDFWRTHLEPMTATAARAEGPAEARAVVAATYANDPARVDSVVAVWLRAHPDDGVAHKHRARALVALRRFEEGGAEYERALALGVDDAGVLMGLGSTRNGQQRWAEAADLLARAVEKGARHSMAYGALAWAQLNLGRNEAAVQSYEKAFEAGIPPGRTTRGAASYNLACGYARIGQTAKALDALAQAAGEGFGDRASMDADPDLAPLRADPRYREITARLPAARSN